MEKKKKGNLPKTSDSLSCPIPFNGSVRPWTLGPLITVGFETAIRNFPPNRALTEIHRVPLPLYNRGGESRDSRHRLINRVRLSTLDRLDFE